MLKRSLAVPTPKSWLPAAAALLAVLLLAPPFAAAGDNAVRLNFLEGKAFRSEGRDGPWEALKVGDEIAENRYFKTGGKSRAELLLPDRSVLRVSEETVLKISRILFKEKEQRLYATKLVVGRLWAGVRKFFGLKSRVDVGVSNAVAGIRGTTFLVEAGKDDTGSLAVYEGKVELRSAPAEVPPPAETGQPREVGGPQPIGGPKEVGPNEWSLLLEANQRVAIPASGEPGAPVSFDPKEVDDFVSWNMERDKAAAE